MLNWSKTWWPLVILVFLVVAVIDGTLSSLLTCHPVSAQTTSGAYSKPSQEECTALRGPVLISLTWLLTRLHKYEGAVIALFTIMLAVFTARLWFSTDKLWEATRKLAVDAERTAQNQSTQTQILERAYITVDPLGIELKVDGASLLGQVGFRNVGNLPARDVGWFVDIKWSYRGDLEDGDFPLGELKGKNVAPHGTVRQQRVHWASGSERRLQSDGEPGIAQPESRLFVCLGNCSLP